jgi:hypothetical protein
VAVDALKLQQFHGRIPNFGWSSIEFINEDSVTIVIGKFWSSNEF